MSAGGSFGLCDNQSLVKTGGGRREGMLDKLNIVYPFFDGVRLRCVCGGILLVVPGGLGPNAIISEDKLMARI